MAKSFLRILIIFGLCLQTLLASAQNSKEQYQVFDKYVLLFKMNNVGLPIPQVTMGALISLSSNKVSAENISEIVIHSLANVFSIKSITVSQVLISKNRVALLINAQGAWTVNSVEIVSDRRDSFDKIKLENLLNIKKYASIFTMSMLDEQASNLEEYIQKEGYLKAKVNYVSEELTPGKLDIKFFVARNKPCLIANFVALKTQIRMFKNITSGDLCNKISIANKLKEEEVRMKNSGYISAKLRFRPELDLLPTKDLERATLQYEFDPGPLWSFAIIDRVNDTTLEEDFMNETGFVLGDLAYVSYEELRQRILAYLQGLGYADALVSIAVVEQPAKNQKRLIYEAQLGRKILIDYKKTEFVGDLPIERNEVLSSLGLIPDYIWQDGIPYVESNLVEKREMLSAILIDNGYLEAKVFRPEIYRDSSSDRMKLRFRFDSGPLYLVKSVLVSGKPKNFEVNTDLINEYIPAGKPLQIKNIKKFENTLQNELGASGYRLAVVRASEVMCAEKCQKTQGKVLVDLEVKITSGPLFRINKILVNEVPFDKGERILAISGLKPGDVLSTTNLAQARDKILTHALFDNIIFEGADNVLITQDEKNSEEVYREINILAISPRTWTLSFNPAWNSERGYSFRTDFQRNNLTKDGLQFFFQGNVTQDRYQNITSTNANVGQLPGLSLNLGLREALFRFGNWISPFDINLITVGQDIEVRDERKQTTRVQSDLAWHPTVLGIDILSKAEVSYAFSGYMLGGVSQPIKIIDKSNQVGVVEIGLSSSIDTRDNPVWPRKGMLLSLSANHSGKDVLSEVSFNKFGFDTEYYLSSNKILTHALAVGAKTLTSVNAPGGRREKMSNIQVRGFPIAEASLGPLLWHVERDLQGKCVGKLSQVATTNVFAAKAETRLRSFQSNHGLIAFFDTATSYFTPSEGAYLNSILKKIPVSPDDYCPANRSEIINNEKVNLNLQTSFLKNYWDSSYQTIGIGYRYFMYDIFALHFDWGVVIQDPVSDDKLCSSYSAPYLKEGTTNSAPTPPVCIRRKPMFQHPWDTLSNVSRNSWDFLRRVNIAIEGKF